MGKDAHLKDPPRFLVHDNDGKFGQFGEVRRVERDGKKISCRSVFAGWLWEVMGVEGRNVQRPSRQARIT